jgi:hypothetical protein
VLDDAVFAGGIDRLEDEQDCPAVLSIQPFLKLGIT